MTFVLAGYYGFGNAGDELILAAIVREFRRINPGGRLVVLSNDPAQTRASHGIEAIDRWSLLSVFSTLRQADRFVMGGGGLFQDSTSGRSLFYYLGLLLMARLLRIPLVLFSVGVEKMNRSWGRRFLARLMMGGNVRVFLRDADSLAKLIEWGVAAERLHLTSDSVFLMGPLPQEKKERRETAPVLVIPRFPCPPEGRQLYRSVIRVLREEGFPVQIGLFHMTMEKPAWETFAADQSGIELLEWRHPMELVKAVTEARFMVSARFHGLVLAELTGTPAMGMGDPDKTGRFSRDRKQIFLGWSASDNDLRKAFLQVRDVSNPSTGRISEEAARIRQAFQQVFSPLPS